MHSGQKLANICKFANVGSFMFILTRFDSRRIGHQCTVEETFVNSTALDPLIEDRGLH